MIETCFFKLKLPNYSSKKILEEKMNYSILNCVEIDEVNQFSCNLHKKRFYLIKNMFKMY